MANKSISLIDIRQILRMHHEHHSMRKIENYLGVARKTVSKYIILAQSATITYPDIQHLSDEELLAIILEQKNLK